MGRRSERASNESGTQTTTQQDLCHHKTLCVERRALRETEVTRLTRALAKSKRKRSFPSSRPFQQQQQQQHGDERGAEEKHAFQMPQEAKGGYKEFLDTVGLDTNRGLRSTTDE